MDDLPAEEDFMTEFITLLGIGGFPSPNGPSTSMVYPLDFRHMYRLCRASCPKPCLALILCTQSLRLDLGF